MREEFKCPIFKMYVLVLIIVFIIATGIALGASNEVFKQSAEIQMLEQNNFEQQEEKEMYRKRSQELENIIVESGIVVDDCECE